MRKLLVVLFVSLSATALIIGCAQGPVVPVAPTVRVSNFRSELFTPDYVRFFGQVVINNNMRAPMNFQKVDYGMSLFDKSLDSRSFTGMKQISSNGTETVSLPMRIPMKKILAQNISILAEGKMKFNFHGSVYPAASSGFGPIPFSRTIEIPIPNIPNVTFLGSSGVPLTSDFRIEVGIQNTNKFPISINNVRTYIDLNGQRYTLLRTKKATEIQPGTTGTVVLTMRANKASVLSMALNMVENNAAKFKVGGSFTAGTPYGYVFIPVEISAKSQSKK